LAQIAATIIDAADIRAHECMLPDAEPVSKIALRLAELIHLPMVGPDGRAMAYGLIPKGGPLLDLDATLAELNLPSPLTLRLVPEISAGKDEVTSPEETGAAEEAPEMQITVGEPVALVHDTDLGARPDVRIDAEVHRDIEGFALANRNRECAGLLLGSVDSEGKVRIIHVSAAIPAQSAVGTRASVRIPLSAWEEMLRVRDLEYDDLRILGWFHTHAGWGVFMSDADIFIHRHFFPHPNMVAYVLDPTTGRDGFFYWHDGKIGLCPSYGLVGPAVDAKPRKPHPEPVEPMRRRFDIRTAVIVVLAVAVLYLTFAGSPFARHSDRRPSAPRGAVVETKELPAPRDRNYTIVTRDNPWSICNRIYGDGELGPALMRYNGLKPNPRLRIGQKIKLPPKQTLKKLARP
jgi:proteasome lid subunit RPN8/RPN11